LKLLFAVFDVLLGIFKLLISVWCGVWIRAACCNS